MLLVGWLALAQAAGPKQEAPAPAVAAIPLEWRTIYEADTFQRERLRDSTTVVTRILLIREDGTVKKMKVR